MPLVGNGLTTTDAKTGARISANVVAHGTDDLNSTGATSVPAEGADVGFAFFNAGAGPGKITLSKDGYETRTLDVTFPIPTNINYELTPTNAPGGPIQRVHVDGLGYRTADGKAWHGYSMTGFRDYQRFLDGEDIRPLLAQARSLGANMRRVFGMWGNSFQTPDNYGPFRPQDRSLFYKRLPEFEDLYAEYGMWPELCSFADTMEVMPVIQEQADHYKRSTDALRWAFSELVNENDQHNNAVGIVVDPINGNRSGPGIRAFTKPAHLTACSGSNGAGNNPTAPFWDYSNLHAERTESRLALTTSTVWYAINGYIGEGSDPGWPGTHQATNNDEPGRTLDPFTAYQMGVGSRYGGWVTSHTVNGTQSLLLDPTQAECTRQMFAGARGDDFSG